MKQRISHKINSSLWRMILSVLIVTISITTAYSQEQEQEQQLSRTEKVDSIEALLPTLSKADKLNAIANIINLHYGLPTRGHYLRMYLDEARLQQNDRGVAQALAQLTAYYYNRFDNDSVFIFGEEAVRFNRQHQQYEFLFNALRDIIRRHLKEGRMLTALRMAEEAYAEAKELQENLHMAKLLFVLGDIFYQMEQYEEAIRYWTECIPLYEQDEKVDYHYPAIYMTYHFLTYMANYLERPDEMLRYTDSMQVVIERLLQSDSLYYEPQRDRFLTEYNRAIAFAQLKQPEQSLQAIRRAEEIDDPQYKETQEYANHIDEMYGEYYIATGRYDKALEHLERVLKIYEERGLDAFEIKRVLAQSYTGKGDHEAAANLYRQMLKQKEERNNERFYAQINELRTLYELDKAEMESERRLAAIRQQRTMITGLGGVCIALIVIVALVVWSRRQIGLKNIAIVRQIKELQIQYETTKSKLIEKTHFERKPESDDSEAQESNDSEAPLSDNRHDRLCQKLRNMLLIDKIYVSPNLSRDDLARQLGVNVKRLTALFLSCFGTSYHEYINSSRLHDAIVLLEQTQNSILVIAEKTGFGSVRSFQRQFLYKYKMTHNDYRKSLLAIQQQAEG